MDNSEKASLSSLEQEFLEATHSREPVSGLTHNFYYYPARFSHLFARAAIELFTKPSELVFDPFMGGGTTLVEAQYLRRQSVGTDINSLATLISRVKTTPFFREDIQIIEGWFSKLPDKLNLRNAPKRAGKWVEHGYQRNINGKRTWPIRKSIELALAQIDELGDERHREFVRCVLLKTGQWAIHRRKNLPTASEFRSQLFEYSKEMLDSIVSFSAHLQETTLDNGIDYTPVCLNCDVTKIEVNLLFNDRPLPKLILTSPPYPGVHVLYHRWQVDGRKETPAPYWIANSLDGEGASFYTLGGRFQSGLEDYFSRAEDAFRALSEVSDRNTIIVQMVGFSDRSWQLSAYLDMMQKAGFLELKYPHFANSSDGRLWRSVPNRKWYTYRPGTVESSKEVVLFHKLASDSSSERT